MEKQYLVTDAWDLYQLAVLGSAKEQSQITEKGRLSFP